MSESDTQTAVPVRRLTVLLISVVVLALTLTWAFLSMRTVMDVGGSCADGGPYVSAQPCPGGAGFIGIAIPVMILATFAGTFAAVSLNAPNLLVPMWTVLFAIPRTAGWLAQWLELVDDKEQKIARPKQIYTGDRQLEFVPAEKRWA